ncbi:MAG: glycoside hydrolase family 2, partial [Anaerolineae bacterium]|nr:glycoside hydrolase family 2 [Anaerolineae bacterium]
MRVQESLAGSWQFQIDPEGLVRVDHLTPDREIPVPLPWQAAFPELETYSGYAWYVRDVEVDADWLAGEVLLQFGAVDYWCEVFVNGQRAGEHEGGYTAFEFPIRAYLKTGKNQIAVRVYDAAYPGLSVPRWYDESNQQTDGPFNPVHIPQGKQSWYLECGGIWQDVTLTAVPAVYVDQLQVTPNIHDGSATVVVMLNGDLSKAEGTLTAAIGATSAHAQLIAGQGQYQLVVNVPQSALWTPETPNLYTVTVNLASEGGDDSETARFGFREIATRDGQLLLNGEPIYLLAALDQDMYPETIYTVPSEAFLRDEFQKAKALGLNCLRCHIKPPDPLYLDLADEMGLLVWAEIPSWRTFYVRTTLQHSRFNVTDDIKARANQTLREMIARDFNHPALVIWSIVNEDWGTATNLSPNDRVWLAEMYDTCKALDPTRLAVDNSACIINLHVKSDLDDYHVYANIPDSAGFFDQFIEAFSRRASWSFSSHGDAQRTGHEPLILSEFGNWGLPSIEALRNADGSLPDWFKLGPWWSGWEGEPGWPKGTLERFQRLGLTAIWKDYEAFAEASQWHQYHAMKYEIEVMRRQPALQGYVITELSDIYWESNGLLDFNRGTKAYHDIFASVNAPDVIVPRLRSYATWDDQTLPIQIFASHYGGADWSETSLKLTLNGQTHEQTLPIMARGSVTEVGVQELQFAPVAQAENQSLDLTIVDPAGAALAANQVDILVLPSAARQPGFSGQLTVAADS